MRRRLLPGLSTLILCSFPLAAQRVSPLRGVTVDLLSISDSGRYLVYSYRVANAADSKGGLATIAVEISAPRMTGLETLPSTGRFINVADSPRVILRQLRDHVPLGALSPLSWQAFVTRDAWLSWSGDSIGPGASFGGLGLRSPYLPGLRRFLAEPTAASCCDQPGSPTTRARPKPSEFRALGWTVAPTYAPGQVTLGVLGDLVDRSCGELAWVRDSVLCRGLREDLRRSSESVQRGDVTGATAALRAFRGRLDARRGPAQPVRDNVYWLLVPNVEQLVRNAATAAWQDPFPPFAVRELADFEPGVTVADWLRAHPTDTLSTVPQWIRDGDEDWCARAGAERRLPDSSRSVRYAHFYVPPLTEHSTVPAVANPEAIARRCVLGAIWVEAGVATVHDAERNAVLAGDALTAIYGGTALSWPARYHFPLNGSAGWNVKARTRTDSTIILSASEDPFLGRGQRILALAFAPLSRLAPPLEENVAERYQREAASVGDAAVLTGLDRTRIAPLLSLLARAESALANLTHPDRAALRSTAVATFRDWLTAARSLPPSPRAAALLAADRLLATRAVQNYFNLDAEDSIPGRVPLEALGAGFDHEYYNDEYVYAHTWLNQALRMDPDGRAGAMAFTALIEVGFDTTGSCAAGGDPFQEVIDRGEAYLPKLTDSSLAARVHFVVGDAYAEIVGLAAGMGDYDYGDSTRFLPRAAPARIKALEHYRAGLAFERGTTAAAGAWRTSWRLAAGLPPVKLRFLCIND